MRRLSSNSRKNQIYKALREVGRVMRTVALLQFLADSGLRARVTAATNKAEAYNEFSAWAWQPGRDRRERPGRAVVLVKWNSLLCNLIVFHTAIDMMEVIRQLVAEGGSVTEVILACTALLTSPTSSGSAPTQPTNSTSAGYVRPPRWTRSTLAANSPRPPSRAR